MYTENTKEANKELKQQISQLKQSILKANSTEPADLESAIAAKEAEIKQIIAETTPIKTEIVELTKEYDACKIKHEALKEAIRTLDAQAEKHKMN